MIKMLGNVMISMLQMFVITNGQTLIGATNDEHGCVTDGGYQWCESLNECVRPWMTPCPTNQPIIDPGFGVPVNPPPPVVSPPAPPTIPYGCATWFDGCNHCMVSNGQLAACTRMMCFTQRPAECLSYNRLNVGDVCYRFCEDGSEQTVNARDKCPSGSQCVQQNSQNTLGFDSCGSSAWFCVSEH